MGRVAFVEWPNGLIVSGSKRDDLIAASLMTWAGATWPVSVFLTVCAAIMATATFGAPETANKDMT